jgi:hydroxymethylpyrimidine pyrophosphatase-like HAD family hydrolase
MDIIQEARELAISEMEKFGLPNMTHFELSENKAIELADTLHADKLITQVGSYLMDLKLGQAFQENKVSRHIQMSVEATKDFLKKSDLDEASQQKIINCVEAHHGNIPFTCIEAEICANADCYRFINPKGFFVYLTILGKRNVNFYDCLENAESKMDEKYKILSLDICRQELEEYYQTLKKYITDAKAKNIN